MLGKTKNFLLSLFQKKIFLSVFFFIFLGLLYPLTALAWLEELAVLISQWVSFPIIRGILWVVVKLAGLAGSLLNWVLSPDFINYSYTKPTGPKGNPVIETGLSVTQGFVNMLLVLVLVYIAIATILRLAGYETKKLLVTFIVVALLVNFAPVICGLIVDASNIVMNFFIQDLKADAFGEAMGREVARIGNIEGINEWENLYPKLVQLAILIPFLFVLIFVLLVFALIFMLRYLVIWLLVILAPLAFVCYILPITKKYWEMWWKQFMAWSFIGVTCGFFLYLGLLLAVKVQAGTAVTAPTTDQGGLFDAILPYFVSVVFLGIGVVFGLQTSAMGATAVMSFAKTKGRATVRGTARGAKWVAKKGARGAGRLIEEKAKLKERVGKVSSWVEKRRFARWFWPERFKKYGEYAPAIAQAQAEAKDYSSRTNMDDVMSKEAIGSRAVGKTLETVMRGGSEDIFEAGRRKFGMNLTDEQLLHNDGFRKTMKRILEIAKQGGKHNDILRRDPRLAALLAGESWADDIGYYKDPKTGKLVTEEQAIQQATSEARGSHIANWEKQVVSRKHLGLPVTEKLMERGRDPFENIARNVKQGVETVQDSIDKLFSNYIDDVLEKTDAVLAEAARRNDPDFMDEAWKEFHEYFKEQHQGKEGFFVALESQRFRDLGYKKGKYIGPGAPPASAAMEGPPPEEGLTRARGPTGKGRPKKKEGEGLTRARGPTG